MEIVGDTSHAMEALELLVQVRPDVVLLDLGHPGADSVLEAATVRAMPVLGVGESKDPRLSACVDPSERDPDRSRQARTMRAQLEPPLLQLRGPRQLGAVGPPRSLAPDIPFPGDRVQQAPTPMVAAQRSQRPPMRPQVVVIGVSTGGPKALARIVPELPADLAVPVLLVQHMPAEFTGALAKRLDRTSGLRVQEARDGAQPRPGEVWIAPGGQHMVVSGSTSSPRLGLNLEPPENSCRPSVDPLFRSAVDVYGARVLAVVLTGMGQDGALGAEQVRRAGGSVLVQDKETSVVWGMPGAIASRGLAHEVLPLEDIASAIASRVGGPLLIGGRS